MLNELYKFRFKIFLFSQLTLLFGVLVFPVQIYDTKISPVLHLFNLSTGLFLLHKKKKTFWLVLLLLLLATLSFSLDIFDKAGRHFVDILRISSYFIFHIVVTRELIIQVWNTKNIDQKTILGLISGFISLGFIGFFICLLVEIFYPGSFSFPENGISTIQNLMYFSYITLLTIGYGEILPQTVLAQKAVVFIGLIGQIYLVVLMGIVIGKYINQEKTS
ncbi:two pore domain potassium channel family protein [Tenacibaculum finnmarkense]|uniref:ion channel n=1 Tax=Tenacibaculum finnmarkense TaxID=2781243 RepID=UPI001E4DB511|nr:ion channel [Tenacibaculum finnmarkense]MCD8403685.1 potassium channel family protein [Tenacibaculum finnmarkense genomovar finnmarkense]MCG8806290.1 two pore domain potassium channel family protein [Tenacibaculum finnmarkense]MCG8857359.1 two pore domain potassium channel family protein [Tenacibaculum finnmarkense]